MDESELQQIVMDISQALGADTEIHWDDMHVTSWQRDNKVLALVGLLITVLFLYFAYIGL